MELIKETNILMKKLRLLINIQAIYLKQNEVHLFL